VIYKEGDELHIGNLPVGYLVEKYGEPMYVYDAEVIENQYAKVRAAVPDEVEVFYSMKANPNASVVAALSSIVQGAEVSSLRELYVAQQAGFSPDRIIFVGPSKTEAEITEAISKQISCLVVESEHELYLADRIASQMGRTIQVALRINPAFDAAGSKLKMGGSARQFGIDEEAVEDVIRRARSLSSARIIGIQVYLGTRILDHEVAWKNTKYVLELGRRLQEEAGLEMRFIDFGGGLGVSYFAGEHDFDIDQFGTAFREFFSGYRKVMPNTRFIMELGRYLVAESGVYVTRVQYVKMSRGQKFVLASGGLNHHQATTSLGALVKNHFPIEVITKMSGEKTQDVTVCGPLCTPTDVLGKAVKMVDVQSGDLLGILKSGAYGLTASPIKFLSHDHPMEVMVYKGRDFLIRGKTQVERVLDDQVLVPLALQRKTVPPAAHAASESL
jgi:diaminopimelate decarboxylase